jgi:hypothetical protein
MLFLPHFQAVILVSFTRYPSSNVLGFTLHSSSFVLDFTPYPSTYVKVGFYPYPSSGVLDMPEISYYLWHK